MFTVRQPTRPVDPNFLLVSSAEDVFLHDKPQQRQLYLEELCYGEFPLLTMSGDATKRLVSALQVSLQYVLHRLGQYGADLRRSEAEREALFEELVSIRQRTQRPVLPQPLARDYPGVTYKCPLCPKSYPLQYALESHFAKRHTNVRRDVPLPRVDTASPQSASPSMTEFDALRHAVDDIKVELRVARELRREAPVDRAPSPAQSTASEALEALRRQNERLDAIERSLLRNSDEWRSHLDALNREHRAGQIRPATDARRPYDIEETPSASREGVVFAERLPQPSPSHSQTHESVVVSAATSAQASLDRPILSQSSPQRSRSFVEAAHHLGSAKVEAPDPAPTSAQSAAEVNKSTLSEAHPDVTAILADTQPSVAGESPQPRTPPPTSARGPRSAMERSAQQPPPSHPLDEGSVGGESPEVKPRFELRLDPKLVAPSSQKSLRPSSSGSGSTSSSSSSSSSGPSSPSGAPTDEEPELSDMAQLRKKYANQRPVGVTSQGGLLGGRAGRKREE